ncbi:MAG: hypothetical protein K1060chlam1_01320 [Candidatus Anoxychlamydiales bacterium]|nr:hypothetical protein [Candidatus Anoxychlamydiales bacterium]
MKVESSDATVSLLTDKNKPNIINNTDTDDSLSESEADIYMSRPEYKQYIGAMFLRFYYYYDRSNTLKPRILEHRTSGERKWITLDQAQKLFENFKEILETSNKVTLMTKGIEGLPPVEKPLKQYSHLNTYNVVSFLCCFPCVIQEISHFSKETAPILERSYYTLEPAIALCNDVSFNLVDKV